MRAIQAAAAIVGWWLGWYQQLVWFDELVHVGFGLAVSLAPAYSFVAAS